MGKYEDVLECLKGLPDIGIHMKNRNDEPCTKILLCAAGFVFFLLGFLFGPWTITTIVAYVFSMYACVHFGQTLVEAEKNNKGRLVHDYLATIAYDAKAEAAIDTLFNNICVLWQSEPGCTLQKLSAVMDRSTQRCAFDWTKSTMQFPGAPTDMTLVRAHSFALAFVRTYDPENYFITK